MYRIGWQECGRNNVLITVVVKICVHGPQHARHRGNVLWFKLELAVIAQQPDSVVRLDQVRIKRIADGVQNVGVTIVVKVCEFNSA